MSESESLTPLWSPSPERVATSQMQLYMNWLRQERGLAFADYHALWRWSVDDIEAFWASIWDYFGVRADKPYRAVLERRSMPGAEWFVGAELNYAVHIFRQDKGDSPAILYASEHASLRSLSWRELRARTASVAAHLRRNGVGRGDRVVAYLPNTPDAVVAMLAVVSVGAIWSMCSPDMGARSVLDRYQQIEPVVLLAVTSFGFGGKTHDRKELIGELAAQLPSLRQVVFLPGAGSAESPCALPAGVGSSLWSEVLRVPAELVIDPVPFDHPLWVVYSSGTTGLPKAIVHGHGGVLLEHLLTLGLHNDTGAHDVFQWHSSTGWVMWNISVSAMLVGATIVIYDGNPNWPDASTLWRFAAEARVTFFGAGAAFYAGCQKAGVKPRACGNLSRLRSVGSTGSPLSPESYAWIYGELGPDVWLAPMSGGTDFCGAFVAGTPTLPVYAGEMQCRCLGADVHAYDPAGKPLVGEVGELVCVSPIPSMPLYLWNDRDGSRYHESYFDDYPGVWRHGDWASITPRGGAIVYGRSDATINRYGVRLGSSEIYRAVEEVPEVLDSLVIDMEYLGRESYMPLFVVLREGITLTDELRQRIVQNIRKGVSPRFVPNEIHQVPEVPRTLTGKKLEVPVKKIFLGHPAERAANPGAMANPECLQWYVDFARRLPKTAAQVPAKG
ncbi:MAG: acetoacetate--CoA ligase [Betaproteobacteria bacterium]|nr:acetoacetate--CoA ligase [Betaproteobacteria bacterium]